MNFIQLESVLAVDDPTAPSTRNRGMSQPAAPSKSKAKPLLDREQTHRFVDDIFAVVDLHAKRIESLANGVSGVLQAATLSIHAVGQAYAALAEIQPKHGIKQVDRLLSNAALDVEQLLAPWAGFVLGGRKEVVLSLDWTDFDDDDHTTLCAYVVTTHGRATPLAWKTVEKSTLAGRRSELEQAMICRLHAAIPSGIDVILLADRGFGDQVLYEVLDGLGWDFVIRFRGNIQVEHQGTMRPAKDWLFPTRRARLLAGACVTTDRAQVSAVVVTQDRRMKEPWCLATSLGQRKAQEVVGLYAKRFTIEETFRDQKDLRFGLGLRATHIRNAQRRDRLLLLAAIAQALLTLLGAAAEECGMDRWLKANTVKRRTHSLFRQGLYWYSAIPNMREDWLRPLMEAFDRIVSQHAVFQMVYAVI
jgi:hypothetical protein